MELLFKSSPNIIYTRNAQLRFYYVRRIFFNADILRESQQTSLCKFSTPVSRTIVRLVVVSNDVHYVLHSKAECSSNSKPADPGSIVTCASCYPWKVRYSAQKMTSQVTLDTNPSQVSLNGRKQALFRWTEEDFIRFTKPRVEGTDFLLSGQSSDLDSEDSSDEGGFENVGQAIRAFSIMARQSALVRASAAVSGGVMGRISMKATAESETRLMRPTSASISAAGRSTVILGPNDYVNPNMGSDLEALHTAISVMHRKFDEVPGSYKLWEKWFRPVCDPIRRMNAINRRFEIKYQVKVLDYRRDDQNTARHLQRTIRQLFKSECATLNNRTKNEELGETLMHKLKGDMSTRRKALENAEAQKMTRWIQAGILTNDWTSFSAEPARRKDRNPRHSLHNGGAHQVDPLSTFFQTDRAELMPPSLSRLKEKVQRREVRDDSIVAVFPISTTMVSFVSKSTEQSVVSDFDSLVEMTSVVEKPKKSTKRHVVKLPFKKRLIADTNSLDGSTGSISKTDTTDVPTDSSFLKNSPWTPKQDTMSMDALYERAADVLRPDRKKE